MKAKTVFYCTQCGNEFPKWQGRCPGCGSWNTIVEQPVAVSKSPIPTAPGSGGRGSQALPLSQVETAEEIRFHTGMGELDRVLGGGAVQGSLVLVGGSPGIGKSTLMLQICDTLSHNYKVLYVSGEESARQIKLRAQRLGVAGEGMYLLAETNLTRMLDSVDQVAPEILIVDSIQTMYQDGSDSLPGSVAQVKACAMSLMELAKGKGITVFVIGHINKEGSIAGPKVLEHIVDCVLSFEGEQSLAYRILRATKNRFGATDEIGVFEMLDNGLREVPNPSEMLLSGRPTGIPGSCVTCVMEGVRPVLAEIQALVTPTSQIVGSQAVLNVLMGRYATFTKESKSLLSGEYGELPGTVNEAVRKKAIGESESITCRPADLLEPELARIKQQYSDIAKTEEDVLTCAMFPQVAPDFIRRRDDLIVHEIEVRWLR